MAGLKYSAPNINVYVLMIFTASSLKTECPTSILPPMVCVQLTRTFAHTVISRCYYPPIYCNGCIPTYISFSHSRYEGCTNKIHIP